MNLVEVFCVVLKDRRTLMVKTVETTDDNGKNGTSGGPRGGIDRKSRRWIQNKQG